MTPRNDVIVSSAPFTFKHEMARLNSFAGFPIKTLDVRQLAAVGFFYTKLADIVRCVFCGVEVGEWEEGDDPREEHQKWSKSCKFLCDEEVGNIPVNSAHPPPLPPCSDLSGGCEALKSLKWPSLPLLENLRISRRCDPVHPSFETLESRLRSFNIWPTDLKVKPQQLAEAGFFYTGSGDKTVCFQCGNGLKQWSEDDNPWEEHALFFSKCSFVLSQKGQAFVSKVLGIKPPTLSPKDIQNLSEANNAHQNQCLLSLSSSSSNSSKPVSDTRACKICFTDEVEVVFLPCGHIVSCTKCAASLTTCGLCRKTITATVRVHLE